MKLNFKSELRLTRDVLLYWFYSLNFFFFFFFLQLDNQYHMEEKKVCNQLVLYTSGVKSTFLDLILLEVMIKKESDS